MRAKKTTKRMRNVRRHRLALALVGAMAMPVAPVLAQDLPSTGTVVNGTANISSTGPQMTITQTTKGAIIDWGSFNIGSGYGVTFDQQFGASSVTLNRVVGFGSPTFINGTMNANGSVFLINPAGITFGSGAVVNVGGLVASTLDISNADFLSGLASGHYPFVASGPSAGVVTNFGQLTAADGGTIALIGSYITNDGTINARFGSVDFGAAHDVTLDYFGDGLTQVTISGNGLLKSNCSINCAGGIRSNGNIYARGGHVEMRTTTTDGEPAGNALFVDPANGGRIWVSGYLIASTEAGRRGSVVLDAGLGNIDLGGVEGRSGEIGVYSSNPGEHAGSIDIRANQLFTHLCAWTGGSCVNNNQIGFLNATAYAAGGNGGTVNIDVGRLYHAGVIQALAFFGNGGTVNITADTAEIYSLVLAEGRTGLGGAINITANDLLLHRGQMPWMGGPGQLYSLATLSAYGASAGGSVNLDVANLSMIDLGNVSPEDVNLDATYRPTINVNGYAGNGGTINVDTSNFSLSPWQYFEATGSAVGGNIDINADTINLAGGLVATGGTTWGNVTTTATGSLFAAASAYIKAGTWRVHAPSATIVPASGAQPGSGAVLTDAAISSTLDGGTAIEIFADASLTSGASGNIFIEDGVAIVHESSDDAALELRATGGVYGGSFSIESVGSGSLDLMFSANVNDDNPDEGFVSFHDFVLASNGGAIDMDGNGDGVSLQYGQISSEGGDIDITGDGVFLGVYLQLTEISSGDGDIEIDGSASLVQDLTYPFGVALAGSSLVSTGGDISVSGDAVGGTGVLFWSVYDSGSGSNIYSSIITGSGAITLDSTGLRGLGLGGITLATDSGDIHLSGTALDAYATAAVFLGSGGVTTNGGDITITGTGGATGVWLYEGDLISNGGDISVTGEGFHYGVQVWDNLVSSGSGAITITGTATGDDSTGLNVRDAAIAATSGNITLSGDAESGMGVFFGGDAYGPGSSITTTSGAISVISTGLSGLNVVDVPFTTDTGNITLQGTALDDDFGIYLGATGLSTNGGDITLIGYGTSYTGVFVYGGDLASHGGDITIIGGSTSLAGVQISGSDIDSAGGNISIYGEGAATGLIVSAAGISSGAGEISLRGSGGGVGGSGVWIGQGSVVSATSGDVLIEGASTTYHGVFLNAGDVHTTSGDIAITGTGGAAGVSLFSGELASTSGDIHIAGLGGSDAGLRLDADSSIDAGSGVVALAASNAGSSDAIVLQGQIASTTGVNLRTVNEADSILLGAGNGFSLTAAELARIDAPLLVIGSALHAGAIRVMEAVDWDGDLTLQNQGGSGGIDIQAALDVGDHTLALASGGDIVQNAAGAITAHSLLAIADGDVSLTAADNDVSTDSVAGSAGGDFAYEDMDDVAIGEVSSRGFQPNDNLGLTALSADGIAAEGNVLVRTASGDLILDADVSGTGIDLVAAETFQNPGGAVLTASQGWRIWARTWEGETRGGLQGEGPFDVFGCGFGGDCIGLAGGNQFIYQEQRFIQSPLAPESVVEWIDDDQLVGSSQDLLQAALCPIGDFAGDPLKQGSDSDELARQWLKSRHRLRLNNCIDNKNAPGCRF